MVKIVQPYDKDCIAYGKEKRFLNTKLVSLVSKKEKYNLGLILKNKLKKKKSSQE